MDRNKDDQSNENKYEHEKTHNEAYSDMPPEHSDGDNHDDEQVPTNKHNDSPESVNRHDSDQKTDAEKIKRRDIKKYFLFVLIGGLVVSSLIAVIAVLIGQFNEMTWRALSTTFSIVFHAFAALLFYSISGGVDERMRKYNETYINIVLALIVASFATSVFAIWDILTGRLVGDLYATYVYTFGFASLIRLVLNATRKDQLTLWSANTSIVFSIILYLLLLPSIYTHYPDVLPEIHGRLTAAVGIILGTTSVLTAIFHRLYMQKHPELSASAHYEEHKKMSPLAIVLLVILGLLLLPWLLALVFTAARY